LWDNGIYLYALSDQTVELIRIYEWVRLKDIFSASKAINDHICFCFSRMLQRQRQPWPIVCLVWFFFFVKIMSSISLYTPCCHWRFFFCKRSMTSCKSWKTIEEYKKNQHPVSHWHTNTKYIDVFKNWLDSLIVTIYI